MKTQTEPKNVTEDTTRRPTLSMSRVIEATPSGISFSGWGPKVAGSGGIIKNLN